MESILKQFENKNQEIKSSNLKSGFSFSLHGSFDIQKGSLKQTIDFYANLYESRYKGFIDVDDWGVNEITNTEFSGIKVDSLSKLIESLKNSGLTSLAEGLDISDDEMLVELSKQIEINDIFKRMYGDDIKLFSTLTKDEKEIIKIQYVIDNYGNHNQYDIKPYLKKIDGLEDTREPSIQELQEIINQLRNY
jgi:hypothetical protein